MATHTEHSLVGQVSHPCEGNWEILGIDHKRIPHSVEEPIFEGKDDMG